MTRYPPYWLRATLLSAAAAAVLVSVLFLPLLLHPKLTNADLSGVADAEKRITLQQAQTKLQNDARSTLLQALAGLVLVGGAVATWRQVQIGRHGQITDRITKSVDQLGSTNADVRIGGIYALERVAKNSYEDRAAVTAVLNTFVRTRATGPARPHETIGSATAVAGNELPWLYFRAPDVQAAITVLGRRPRAHDEERLFLSYTDLRKARMTDAWWCDLMCRHAALVGVRLQRSRLDRADFTDSDLRGAYLFDARLVDATLRGANLEQAALRNADLRGADLTDARLEGADLSGVRTNEMTKWPTGFDPAIRQSEASG
jgi:hypothetical protein